MTAEPGGMDILEQDPPIATARSAFDERFYLDTYPDVRAAVQAGHVASGAAHWEESGRQEVVEGRRHVAESFDEAAYLQRRPDVAAAVTGGVYANGYDHWLQWGRFDDAQAARTAAAAAMPTLGHNSRPAVLTDEKVRFWNDNGFVVLDGLISPERCARVDRAVNQAWVTRRSNPLPVSIDVFIDREEARRIPMAEAPAEARTLPYKLNDMFLIDEDVQDLALDADVVGVLRWIMDEDPACVGSLNFERGSTQQYHTDTLYMPGERPNGMAAAWFALEDVTPEAGPLLYYPGSHKFPLFHFSDGRPHQIDAEFGDYVAYMQGKVAEHGLQPQMFLPKRGDVLIWNERLYHGGAPIEDLAQTRKSLVTHYWRKTDLPNGGPAVPKGNGHVWGRDLL